MLARHAEARAEHAAAAVGGVRPQRGKRQRRQVAIGADAVERGGEIAGRVGERAIEIEQNRGDGQRARPAGERAPSGRGERLQCN